jgi:hypothetical protein
VKGAGLLAATAGALALAAWGARAAPASRDAGERLYLEGMTRSGAPLAGTVQGDVPLAGEQASCSSCHGRSGFGSAEGGRVVPPVTGAALRAARERGPRPRPAFDTPAIGRAIREGIGADGKPLDPLMPRYRMDEGDLAPLIAHLDRLSSSPPPGVSAHEIHLATVVTPDAPPAARDAALGVVRAYVASQNSASQIERKGHPRGRYGETEFSGEWFFHPWRLTGPASSWPAQLAALQRARPVFAVVSGAGRDWEPVERFCEVQRIPCLLPNADPPAMRAEGWYSRYFSRGPALEAEVMATRLASWGKRRVLQVYRGAAGAAAAKALESSLARRGLDAEELAPRGPLAADALERRLLRERADALVLWLPAADLGGLRAAGTRLAVPILLSGSFLGGELDAARALGGEGWAIQPWAPEAEAAQRFRTVSPWLASKGLEPADAEGRRWHDQALFATRAFGGAFAHQGTTFSREFLLETLDHTPGIAVLSSYYPRLDFGPGQRTVSKGAWVIPLGGPESKAEWVVP